MTIREELRGALTNVLSNASNFPERVQTRILGQDMGPLTDKAADAAAAALSNLPGGASDGHHTFDELYDYRMLYNAHAARGWLAAGIPVVKSWRHSDGELCFGGGWFIVTATLPTGQVSNHYQAEHWDLFAVPAVELRPEYDGHTPADAADRLRTALAVFEQAYTPTDNEREALRKAVSDAVYGDERVTLGTERLVENLWAAGFRRTAVQEPSAGNMGPAASCHLCVGAGGYEGHDGEWIECSCQRPESQGETEWEFSWAGTDDEGDDWVMDDAFDTRESAEAYTRRPIGGWVRTDNGKLVRRRKAGPWMPVAQGKTTKTEGNEP